MLKTSADILTLPPWAIFFHPPDPPIAWQSCTRDAPFSLVAMASNINDPSKLARSPSGAGLIGLLVLPSTEVDGDVPATCGGCMVLSLWSLRRWRDAMFEGPSGRSRGRTKFAEPSNARAVRFIQRWSRKGAIHFLCPFLACAFGELSTPTVEANSSNVDHIHKILPKS